MHFLFRKTPPTLTSPGKMPFFSKWHHFPPPWALHSGALPTLSWMECVGGVPTLAASGAGGCCMGKGLPVCVHLAECCLAQGKYPILESVTLTKLGYLLKRITLFYLGKWAQISTFSSPNPSFITSASNIHS